MMQEMKRHEKIFTFVFRTAWLCSGTLPPLLVLTGIAPVQKNSCQLKYDFPIKLKPSQSAHKNMLYHFVSLTVQWDVISPYTLCVKRWYRKKKKIQTRSTSTELLCSHFFERAYEDRWVSWTGELRNTLVHFPIRLKLCQTIKRATRRSIWVQHFQGGFSC